MERRLIGDGGAPVDPRWRRWYVLGVYSYISGLQSLLWMTWNSVPKASARFLCQTSHQNGS
eukprot:COSAG01_NODE_30226_length_620_cov_1.055662_1_plen_60_part_10